MMLRDSMGEQFVHIHPSTQSDLRLKPCVVSALSCVDSANGRCSHTGIWGWIREASRRWLPRKQRPTARAGSARLSSKGQPAAAAVSLVLVDSVVVGTSVRRSLPSNCARSLWLSTMLVARLGRTICSLSLKGGKGAVGCQPLSILGSKAPVYKVRSGKVDPRSNPEMCL